ncbi:MAG: PLP-dependent aminotransferase family protein [Verrucomicrobiota bacterium]
MPNPLYQQVADRVVLMMKKGTLKVGDRIPSIRQMREQMSVSMATVMQGYQLLEDRGLIEAKPQSGYYVKPKHTRRLIAGVRRPVEPGMKRLPLKAGRARTEDLVVQATQVSGRAGAIPLGTALPSPELLPMEALNRVLARVVRDQPEVATRYEVPPGLKKLREQISRRAMQAGCSIGRDEIVVTTGATEALLLALRAVTEAADTVAVESPCYFGFLNLLKMLRLKVVEVSTDPKTGISIEHLERLVTGRTPCKALLLTPTVHNPLGCVMPDENKRRIARMMQRAGIPVIEDDTYGDLAFASNRPHCLKSFDRSDNVILCSSFSKTLAPGYRVGWISAGRWHEKVNELKCVSSMGSASPPQLAVASYLASGGFDRHLRRLRRTYSDNLQLLCDAVLRRFPEGTRATRPQGGHLLWVSLPESLDAGLLHHQLAAQNITIASGSMFSAGGHYRNYLRLNAGIPWTRGVERAVGIIGKLALG